MCEWIKFRYTPTAVIFVVFSSRLISMKHHLRTYCQDVSYLNHSNPLFHVQLTPSFTSFTLGVNFPETLGSVWFKSYLIFITGTDLRNDTLWCDGEPNDGVEGETLLTFYGKKKCLNDMSTERKKKFVCEQGLCLFLFKQTTWPHYSRMLTDRRSILQSGGGAKLPYPSSIPYPLDTLPPLVTVPHLDTYPWIPCPLDTLPLGYSTPIYPSAFSKGPGTTDILPPEGHWTIDQRPDMDLTPDIPYALLWT